MVAALTTMKRANSSSAPNATRTTAYATAASGGVEPAMHAVIEVKVGRFHGSRCLVTTGDAVDARTRQILLGMLPGYAAALVIWLFAWLVLDHDFNRAAAWAVVIGFPLVFGLGGWGGRTRPHRRRTILAALAVPLFVWLIMLPVAFTTLPAAVAVPVYVIGALVLLAALVMAFREAATE